MKEGILKIVNCETEAWNKKDIDLLLSIFHPDMVWVWPKTAKMHNPVDWETPQGKFNWERWSKLYQDLFHNFNLVKNERNIVKIVATAENDGGFAVVDIDTLWVHSKTGEEMHWLGRTCKTYVKTAQGIKMIAQTGVLDYSVEL